MDRVHWMAIAAVIGVALGAGAWFGTRGPEPPPPISVATPPPTAAALSVHVAGEVARPGLVRLPAGARVADAVAAAGGATPDADLAALNLAAPVVDGGQVVVPGRQDAAIGGGGGPVTASGPLRLNSATSAELETLPGIGPVTAARIVAHRQQHGPFGTVEDLLDVPGIGEGRLAALRDLVAVP